MEKVDFIPARLCTQNTFVKYKIKKKKCTLLLYLNSPCDNSKLIHLLHTFLTGVTI